MISIKLHIVNKRLLERDDPGESVETHLPTNWRRKISPGSNQQKIGGKTFNTFDSKKMNWSFSRERMLKDCEKKYFYHYIIPSYTAKQIDENILKNVLFLRKLTNRHLLLGKVIHHTISESVHSFYKNHLVPLSEMMDKCWERFIRARQFSQDQKYLFQTPTHPDFTILFEDFYGIDLHDRWLTQHYQKMKTALRHFYKWFVTDTNQRWSDFELIENEQLKSFLERDVQVWTVIDLLLKSPQNVWYIIDWKLSTFDWEKDGLQLAF